MGALSHSAIPVSDTIGSNLKEAGPVRAIKFIYTNADTLTNKLDELKTLVNIEKPELVAVTEVLPKNSQFPVQEQELQIEGYNSVSNIQVANTLSVRGIILYIKHNYTNTVQEIQTKFQEYLSVEITSSTGSVISVCLIYRSPNSSQQNNKLLLKSISDFCAHSGNNAFILGDFNLPKIDWANNKASFMSYEEEFLTCLLDNFLHQHVLEPTRSRGGQQENILDLVLSKDEQDISEIELMSSLGKSDHLVMRIILNIPTHGSNISQNERLQLYRGDYSSMREELQLFGWEEDLRDKSTSQCWEFIRDQLLQLQKKYIPVAKTIYNPKPGWMNREVTLAFKEKQKAWKRYNICRIDGNFEAYKKARNTLKRLTQDARKGFEKKIVAEIKDKPKSFWKFVSKKTKHTPKICRVRNSDGQLTQSNLETAECLNAYFSSVFTEDSDYCPPCPPRGQECLSSFNIEEENIVQILKELKVDKAAGPDGILPRVLFETSNQIAKPLKILFDKSLENGEVPSDWKRAIVVPIFKKGGKDLSQNYRPVSLTCIICKIMERLIRDKMMEFLTSTMLLSDKQFGFVPGRSCTLQLLVCVEQWSKQFDQGTGVDTIYTDFSKAFDRVSHTKLLSKILSFGIKGNIANWIKDFLSERYQRVRVEGSLSDWTIVKSGVPQGSVLGPTLFVLYINDLPDALHEDVVKLFADDAKLSKSISSVEDAISLQKTVDKLVQWSDKWSLSLNSNKCKVLHLAKSENAYKHKYSMPGADGPVILQETEYEKDLGVYVDSKLTFETHVNKSVQSANKITGIIKRNFKYMGEDIFLNLYKTLVRPYLEYSSVVWDPATIRDQKLLEGVQRRATKLIPTIKDLSYEQRLVNLGLPSLQYRRARADMIQVYKIVHGMDRIDPTIFFELVKDFKTRGHKYKLCKPRCRTSFRRHTFSNRVVDTWNSLPAEIVEAPDINSFKSQLNTFWKHHPLKFSPSFY